MKRGMFSLVKVMEGTNPSNDYYCPHSAIPAMLLDAVPIVPTFCAFKIALKRQVHLIQRDLNQLWLYLCLKGSDRPINYK